MLALNNWNLKARFAHNNARPDELKPVAPSKR